MSVKIAVMCVALVCCIVTNIFVQGDATTAPAPNILETFSKPIDQFRSGIDQAFAKTVDQVNVKHVQPVFELIGDQLNRFSKATNIFVQGDATTAPAPNILETFSKPIDQFRSGIDQAFAKTVDQVNVKHVQPVFELIGDQLNRFSKAFEDLTATKAPTA